jgi:hypothetical protein
MIKINQVAALRAKVFLHLADDPGRSVPDRVDVGGRAGPIAGNTHLKAKIWPKPVRLRRS